MHIFFSGIGGAGIGPLALIAKQAGYTVSGSDKQDSQYIEYLKKHGITDIYIGQTLEQISAKNSQERIDWYVYSSAVEKENPSAPEFVFVDQQHIKRTKRDEFIKQILGDKKLKLIAVAGTHGKSTTTAMIVWLFKQLELPVSYSVGAKLSFGDMGQFEENSEYFVYECDEFDRNFLSFQPYLSVITGVSWDHHEIYRTREDYQQAFNDFIDQSEWTILWHTDYDYLNLHDTNRKSVFETDHPDIKKIGLAGEYNRYDAWLAIQAVHEATKQPVRKLLKHMSKFPGLQRRMEQLIPNLYSDYAHTPEKIRAAMSVATEMAAVEKQKVIVVYEPLTNRRQHYMLDDYGNCFEGADKVYWIPSYLAREDPDQTVLEPSLLISHLSDPSIAVASNRDEQLKTAIADHLKAGDMVVGMAGGGGDCLDEWLRREFPSVT